LTKLQFLSLPDNPNLQRLPDCIKDLPKLSIINLKNSNSNALPEDLRDLPEESDLHIFV
jgi:Leucine-rich repeat (LRR) protein